MTDKYNLKGAAAWAKAYELASTPEIPHGQAARSILDGTPHTPEYQNTVFGEFKAIGAGSVWSEALYYMAESGGHIAPGTVPVEPPAGMRQLGSFWDSVVADDLVPFLRDTVGLPDGKQIDAAIAAIKWTGIGLGAIVVVAGGVKLARWTVR